MSESGDGLQNVAHNFLKRRFADFLDLQMPSGAAYPEKITQMVESNQNRFIFNINDLRDFDADFARRFIANPFECIAPFEEAVNEAVDHEDPSHFKELGVECRVGVEGSFGANHVTPRFLTSELLNQLVCVEGIVTKCSMVRPKLQSTVHYCEATHSSIVKKYFDHTSANGTPTPAIYPTKDNEGNPYSTEFGLSVYRDHQTFCMQEMPERAPAGQLPRSIDVIIEDDLVERVKPGDRIHCVGVYRALPNKRQGTTTGVFRTVLIANNVIPLRKQSLSPNISEQDVRNIRELSAQPDVFEVLSRSIAPSIFGHDIIKKALLLQLLGGVERNIRNGHHIRGDINILFVGDPSTAKSQLLRFILHIAPLAVSTTGRGSTGVGLTAAVGTDSDTGERTLQAGAMVLADRGVVCIDEFDKMSEIDRVAMHEVMEQQTVTIAKAGIHTTLNARCSVVAAANPLYGQYNPEKDPAHNIALPDSLLSRFDLLFIVLDSNTEERDKKVAQHVLRLHRYRGRGDEPGLSSRGEEAEMDPSTFDKENEEQETPQFQRFDASLHDRESQQSLLTVDFLKKYIFYAKSRMKPELTEAASERISEEFAKIRSEDKKRTLPITPRSLECMIRLATAHAKCRLSPQVTREDADKVIEIVRYALFMENQMQAQRPPAPRPLRRPRAAEPGRGPARRPDEGSDGSDSDPGPSSSSSQRQLRSRRKRAFQVSSQESGGAADDFSFDHSEDPSTTTLDVPSTSSLPPSSSARAEKDADTSEDEESSGRPIPKRRKKQESQDRLPKSRASHMRKIMVSCFQDEDTTRLDRLKLLTNMQEVDETITSDELSLLLDELQDINLCMLVRNTVFLTR